MELYHAIKELYPDAEEGKDFVLQDDGKGPRIKVWRYKNTPQPTQTELEAAYQQYLQKKALTEYREKRATEYPHLGDQLDAIWKALKAMGLTSDPLKDGNTPEGMLARIEAIKQKYPKPSP